jgi:hypothetical protein
MVVDSEHRHGRGGGAVPVRHSDNLLLSPRRGKGTLHPIDTVPVRRLPIG